MFSDIVQRFDTTLNALYQERDARLKRGQKVVDLVSGNANRAGFIFPPKILKQALALGAERAQIYAPDPLGQLSARETVQAYYRTENVAIPASQIVLTPGTSLSYLYLFKLLANPDDEILCPQPSYPLLDSIAEICRIKLTHYQLVEGLRWDIDLDSVRSAITPKTRAIVLISPHNPTGAVATEEEIDGLVKIAAKHNLPIISDEVFSPFLFNQKRLPRPATSSHAPLVFTLNGISKMFALAGMKIGWIAATGDPAQVKKALHALDMISDTFLPVNEAAQFALPLIFSKGKPFLKQFTQEIKKHAEITMKILAKAGSSFIKAEGGFYLTIQLKDGEDEETTALNFLKKEGHLLHPGYFYDLEGKHIVLSFATPLPDLRRFSKRPPGA